MADARRTRSTLAVVAANVAFSLAGLCVVVAGVEAYTRLFVPRETPVGGRYLPHDTLNHVFVPNAETRIRAHPDVPEYTFRSNELGLRIDQPYTLEKPAGTWRILVCGDSFVEGYVWDETLPAMLEAALEDEVAAKGRRLEVINAGIASYSPMLHYFALREKLLALEPDAVLLAIDLTDAHDDANRYAPLLVEGSDGAPLGVQSRMAHQLEALRQSLVDDASPLQIDYWIALTAPYLQFARRAFDARALDWARQFESHLDPALRWREAYYDVGREDVARAIDYSQGWIVKIRDLLAERHIPLLVAMYPHRPLLERPELQAYLARYHRFAAREGLPLHDATAAFARAGTPAELFLSENIHFNARGQRVWLQALLPAVRRQLLPQ